MLFSKRKELADQYEKWLAQNDTVSDCPLNVITFLDSLGQLKENSQPEE